MEAAVPVPLRPAGRRAAQAPARGRAGVGPYRRRGGRGRRGRPAPDVRRPALPLRPAPVLDQLRRAGHHGLRRPGGHGGQGRPARRAGGGDRRRRLLPDDRPGAGHLHHRADPDQGLHPQQRPPGHGPPVAGAVLRRALLRGAPRLRVPGLREAGRGLRGPWPALRPGRGGRRHPGEGPGHRRPAGGGGLPGRLPRRGLPDGPGRPAERRDHPRPRVHPRGAGGGDPPGGAHLMSMHTISVLVEYKPGVLARVAGLFSRRGFNIESLAVGPTEQDDVSRMTIVVAVEELPLEQVTKQLNKLVNVLKIVELEQPTSVQRELLLVKVRADATVRSQVLETVHMFRAKVVDVSPEALTVEATGTADKLDALRRMLEPYGIREMVQSGMVAIGRGPRSITAAGTR